MTIDEIRQQRGELTVDCEDAHAHAMALRVAIKGEVDRLVTVAEWLEEAARSSNVSDLGDEFFSRKMSTRVNIVKDQRFRQSLNFDHIVQLRSELIATQNRVEELATRLREIKAVA